MYCRKLLKFYIMLVHVVFAGIPRQRLAQDHCAALRIEFQCVWTLSHQHTASRTKLHVQLVVKPGPLLIAGLRDLSVTHKDLFGRKPGSD